MGAPGASSFSVASGAAATPTQQEKAVVDSDEEKRGSGQDKTNSLTTTLSPDESAGVDNADTLDLTGQGSIAGGDIKTPEIGKIYDPRPLEDNARRNIAYMLVLLLWTLVVAMLGMLMFEGIQVADIKEFSIILGPVVTLVSAATGFYYGTKSK